MCLQLVQLQVSKYKVDSEYLASCEWGEEMSVSQYFLALKAGCAIAELISFLSAAAMSIQCENNHFPVTNTSLVELFS